MTSGLAAEAVVFDLDGTLIDSIAGIAFSLRQSFRQAAVTMPERDLRPLVGPPIRVIARQLVPSLSEDEVRRIEAAYREIYDSEGWSHSTLFAGVLETLDELRRAGSRLFVVTNKPRLPTARILERFGLRARLTDAVSRDSRVPAYVDKAEMLGALVEAEGLTAAKTWMVGDTSEDAEASARCGLGFLFAAYGYGCMQEPVQPLHAFPDVLSHLLPESVGIIR